jgi:hypothetical protein
MFPVYDALFMPTVTHFFGLIQSVQIEATDLPDAITNHQMEERLVFSCVKLCR